MKTIFVFIEAAGVLAAGAFSASTVVDVWHSHRTR